MWPFNSGKGDVVKAIPDQYRYGYSNGFDSGLKDGMEAFNQNSEISYAHGYIHGAMLRIERMIKSLQERGNE